MFVTAIISLSVIILVISILCTYMNLKTLATSLALQQLKEVGAVATQETLWYIECTCKVQRYTILMPSIYILGLILFVIMKLRKLKLFRWHLFSNTVKHLCLLLFDTKYYVPIKLCTTSESIHLFTITGTLTSENIKLKQNKMWVIIKIYWEEVSMTFNWNKFDLPKSF